MIRVVGSRPLRRRFDRIAAASGKVRVVRLSFAMLVVALLAVAGCESPTRRPLDLDLVRVSPNAKLRTDTVDDGRFASTATFVLVDAENTGAEGAYVTLAGQLGDADGKSAFALKPQSLWIPAREVRTFALVDRDHQPRPEARTAKIVVRSGTIPARPPPVRIDAFHQYEDHGKLVVQAAVHNDAARPGRIMVIASFHGADGQPMTRPFSVLTIGAHQAETVQFVSLPRAQRGAIYFGDMTY